jgi:hypothetical protein
MNHSDFSLGGTFWCAGGAWRCTDIGTRVIVAIPIDSVEVRRTPPGLLETLSQTDVEADGWFNGPPYAVAEHVFDENDLPGCSLVPSRMTALWRGSRAQGGHVTTRRGRSRKANPDPS